MKIVFCGDIVPTTDSMPIFDGGNADALMGTAVPLLKEADFAVGNLECALTDSEKAIRKCGPNLKGRPEHAKLLADCGYTHLGLCNNHTLDFGIAGIHDTEHAIQAAGMMYFGTGENDQDSRKSIYLEKNGVKVAIYAACEHEYSYALPDQYGANPFDPFDSMEDIARAKDNADYVVVMYHGGKEHCEYPSPRLRKACRAMVRAGADLVLCQHSHCVGCREWYKGGEIVYGQGNFHFACEKYGEAWNTGLMVCLTIENGVKIQYLPVTAQHGSVALAEAENRERILTQFEKNSQTLQDDAAWHSAWVAFCESNPYYYDAVSKAYVDIPEGEICRQVFPHYLDCEAHVDVWKTLYQTWHTKRESGA